MGMVSVNTDDFGFEGGEGGRLVYNFLEPYLQFSKKIPLIGQENRSRKKKSLWDPAPAHNFF